MTTAYTSLLGLALPVTGELSGTWGDTVNNYITSYLDAAVEGTQTISGSQTAVTLSVTTNASLSQAGAGTTGSAQYSVINCTGNPGGLLTITVPASSRQYIVINATSTSQSVKVVGVGPTTGVTMVSGEKAVIAWNGSDFVKVASTVITNLTGTLPVANGGTGQTTYTDGQLLIGNTSGNTLTKATLTQGSGVTITNGNGSITISATGSGGDAVLANNNAFTGANTFFNATGQTFAPATANDGIIVQGRAGGSSSYRVTFTPTTLTASRTATFPDASFTVGYQNIPYTTDKTTSYTLAVGDVGKVIGVGTGGSIEIPNSTFAAGDAVLIFNNTTGAITITCTITTAYIAGTDSDKATVSLATRGVANILFVSGTVCVITGNVS